MINQSVEKSSGSEHATKELNEVNLRNVLGSTIRILMWNTYKAGQNNWLDDFSELYAGADLVLLQDATDGASNDQFNARSNRCSWVEAGYDDKLQGELFTGVKTGCTVAAQSHTAHYGHKGNSDSSRQRHLLETHYATPASALNTADAPAQTLMVLNAHAIIDSQKNEHLDQFEELCHAISEHTGPVIVGGAFNTWCSYRFAAFQEYAQKASLFEVSLTRSNGVESSLQGMDHVFFRGMSLHAVESLPHVLSSDYSPIRATLVFD